VLSRWGYHTQAKNCFWGKIVLIYPDDRILVAIMNNKQDWQRVLDEGWYRIPAKHAPQGAPNFDYLAFYFTK
jgi:hypothetical protein